MTVINTNPQTMAVSRRWAEVKGAGAKQLGRARASLEVRILAAVFALLALWGASIATFGYPALILPVLCAVPVIFVLLILITVGK